jgi:hypothetical protein
MAYRDSLFPFFVLSWKWYLFGLTLLGLNLWYLRVDRQKGDVHKLNVSITSLRACRFGLVLGFFSLFLSAPSQWVFVAAGFLVGAILGLALGINAKRELDRKLPGPVEIRYTGWRQSLPAIFSVFVGIVALVILLERLPYVQGLLLSIWSGGAAFLIALNLLVWLHTKRHMSATKAQ